MQLTFFIHTNLNFHFRKTIKIIVPHKIKYIHHHHTHVLVVKEKKPHKEKYHHLHTHHHDKRKRRKNSDIKQHYYVPYIPHAHGEEDEGIEESTVDYALTIPERVNSQNQFPPTKKPLFIHNNREYEILSSSPMTKFTSAYPPLLDNFYERNSGELIGNDNQNEYYETDPYFPRPDYGTVIPDTRYSKKVIHEIKGPALGKPLSFKPKDTDSMSFRPVTPSYDVYTGPDLFYPTKPSTKKNKKRNKYQYKEN